MAAIAGASPFLRSLSGYGLRDLGRDAIAGLLIMLTAIPLGVGFAQAAGLPPIQGLYTSMAPLAIYGILGSSRHVKLGLDAAAAAMIGSVVVPLATRGGQVDQGTLLALTTTTSLLTGLILLAAGLARAGSIASLLSLPLLVGYQAGIGISVIIGQLPKLLGVPARTGTDLEKLAGLPGQLSQLSWPTLALGATCLAILLAWHAWQPRFPAAIVLLVAATLVSWAVDLSSHGVAVIGALPSGLPSLTLPDVASLGRDIPRLAGVSASLALVIASDVVIASRTFAARGHYRISPNLDIGALGVAQIASGLTGGVPASASYVRTAISENTGSRTQVSAVVGALAMAGVLAWATGLLAFVPLAVLAAVCADACVRLVDVRGMRRLWRQRRSDFVIAAGTAILVLATDPLLAIVAAVAFSLLSFVVRALRPDEGQLGRRAGVRGWFPVDDYADAKPGPVDTVVYDWNGPLVFANAATFHDRALQLCGPQVRYLVIDCSAMTDVDPSAIAMLEEMAREMADRGIELLLAAPAPGAIEQLRRSGLPGRLGKGPHVFLDIDTALAAIGRIEAPPGLLADKDGDGIYEYTKAT